MAKEKMKDERSLVVKKDEGAPEADEVIAKAVIELAAGVDRLLKGPLTKRAVLLLLRDRVRMTPPLSMTSIEAVLDAIPRLREYIKQPSTPSPKPRG